MRYVCFCLLMHPDMGSVPIYATTPRNVLNTHFLGNPETEAVTVSGFLNVHEKYLLKQQVVIILLNSRK